MEVLYEDNHILIINKAAGEIVQGDQTHDPTLADTVKQWLKEKYNKPGNVFCGVTHRIDRPTWGVVVMAKTSKGLSRMNELFRKGQVHKTYWAITERCPDHRCGTLTHWVTPVKQGNKTYACNYQVPGSVKAVLNYRVLASGDRYHLLEVTLLTGRKHQIRCQLSSIGCPIKGDVKYGARRGNADMSIGLQSHNIHFTHPVSGKEIDVTAPLPPDPLWAKLAALIPDNNTNKTNNDENND